EPAAAAEAPRQPQRYYQEESEPVVPKKARNLSWIKWAAVPMVVILLGAAAWFFWPTQGSVAMTIDTTKYQAVFLSNGQVYFGNLKVVNRDYMELSNVYYLERQLTTGTGTETPEE